MSSENTKMAGAGELGWRFAIGVALIVLGYVALAFIPTVTNSNLAIGAKTVITGFIAILPLLSKIGAVAIMGKPGFNYLKQIITGYAGKLAPAQIVSPARYRLGLILFVISFFFGQLLDYLPGFLVDWSANEIGWSLVADVVLVVSLFILGGDFWDKLKALFTYDATVTFPK
jgi:hypothetical protein